MQPLSEIIKLPDINTAEALQRIPGISLETDTGEGRFVNIRGMDSDLNGTTYGGVRLPASNPSSPFGGGRAVAFDTFPTGIVGGVELTKTLRPDLDAEALGGSVNLVPRTGAEHGGAPFLDADMGYGYEPLRDTPVYHAEFSAGRSFDGGDGIGGLFAGPNAFSAVVTAVYHQDKRGIDDVEESYTDQQSSGVPDKVLSNLQFRRYEYHATATALRRISMRKPARAPACTCGCCTPATWSARRNTIWCSTPRLERRLHAPAELHPGPQQSRMASAMCRPVPAGSSRIRPIRSSASRTSLGMVGGSTDFPTFKLDYRASFALGTDLVSTSYGSQWLDPNAVTIDYDNNTEPQLPVIQHAGRQPRQSEQLHAE